MDSFILSDSESDIFASPSKPSKPKSRPTSRPQSPPPSEHHTTPKTPSNPPPTRFDAEEARQASLRAELDGVRNINAVLESVLATLSHSKKNMSTVSSTVTNASELLNRWTRILSQTEHNQRLILDPGWNGGTADVAELEAEAAARQAAAERRKEEEERRREEAQRRAEEEIARRAAATATPSAARGAGTRGRAGRGRIGYSSGYVRAGYSSGYGQQSGGYGSSADNTTSSVGSGRGSNGIGRGVPTGRAGRARGAR